MTGMETLWKEPPGGSRALWTGTSADPGKMPKMILMQLSGRTCTLSLCTAPPSCWHWAQHHPPGVTGHSTTLLLALGTGSSSFQCAQCAWQSSAQGEGTGSWQLPSHRKRTQQLLIHGKPQEAHCCVTLDKSNLQKTALMQLSFPTHSGWVTPS